MINRSGAKKIIESVFDKEDKDKKPIYTSFLETEDYILEEIKTAVDADDAERAQGVHYVVYYKNSNPHEKIEFTDEVVYKDETYKPIVDDMLEKKAIYLPTGIQEYESVDKLIERIKTFLYSYFEVPKFFENFLPYLCLFYWVYEKFPFIPYLHFVGRTSTGKTTAMEVFGSICYKAIDASGSITIASIFRTTTSWRGTLLLDEFDNVGEESRAMLSFLKSGVSNKVILRTEGEKERQVRAYIAKCPKVFTSERPVTDAGLQSRTIVVPMNPNVRKIPLYRLNDFEEEAQEIRNMLLLWRLRNLNKINLKDIKFGYEELSMFDRRVQQVITPSYYLSNNEARKNILQFAKEQQEETFQQRQDSFDGLVFSVLIAFWKIKDNPSLVEITDTINDQLDTSKRGRRITEKRIANLIRNILNLEIEKEGHEKTRIVSQKTNENKIEELRNYYGVPLEQGPHRPQEPQEKEDFNINNALDDLKL